MAEKYSTLSVDEVKPYNMRLDIAEESVRIAKLLDMEMRRVYTLWSFSGHEPIFVYPFGQQYETCKIRNLPTIDGCCQELW